MFDEDGAAMNNLGELGRRCLERLVDETAIAQAGPSDYADKPAGLDHVRENAFPRHSCSCAVIPVAFTLRSGADGESAVVSFNVFAIEISARAPSLNSLEACQ